jgi:hypothetical protein
MVYRAFVRWLNPSFMESRCSERFWTWKGLLRSIMLYSHTSLFLLGMNAVESSRRFCGDFKPGFGEILISRRGISIILSTYLVPFLISVLVPLTIVSRVYGFCGFKRCFQCLNLSYRFTAMTITLMGTALRSKLSHVNVQLSHHQSPYSQ